MAFPPMPVVPTAAQIIRSYLNCDTPPVAVLFVDGEDVEAFECPDRARQAFEDMPEAAAAFGHPNWGEIALMVYKPHRSAYLRQYYRSR